MKKLLSCLAFFTLMSIFIVSFIINRDILVHDVHVHVFHVSDNKPITREPILLHNEQITASLEGNYTPSVSEVKTAPHTFKILPYSRGFDGYNVKVASKACEVIRMSGTGVYTEGVANASCSLAAGRTAA